MGLSKGTTGTIAGISMSSSACSSSSQESERPKTMLTFWNVFAFIMIGITLFYIGDAFQIIRLATQSTHGDGFAEDVLHKKTSSDAPGSTSTPKQQQPQGAPSTSVLSPVQVQKGDDNKSSIGASVDRTFPPFISVMKHGEVDYYTYTPRGQPLDDNERQEIVNTWGSWTLDTERPLLTKDFYANYPNRDVPRNEFPANAWQTNKEYLSTFLPDAVSLVQRAQDAILAEYGQPSTGSWEDRTKMFALEFHPEDLNGIKLTDRKGKAIISEQGGWTTPKSWEALKRRLLHAVMTEDSFVFAMGGHSSAAGHGNHFQQSYTLQVQWILEAVFARLGVRHQSRNFGNGGLGTVQHGMGASSVFGPDVDVLMWDSAMTEGDQGYQDIMHRQSLLGGLKVPILWTEAVGVAKFFHTVMGIPVGCPGSGRSGIIKGQKNLNKVEKEIPFAVQYMDCSSEIKDVCKSHEYDSKCWIDRPDVTPTKEQEAFPGGRAGWHPGNKHHQLRGRVLAFTFLEALRHALIKWKDSRDFEIPDEQWHVTFEFETTRKLIQEHINEGDCEKSFVKHGMADLCTLPMKARTEFTPRAYPSFSSIRTLMPPDMLKHVDSSRENLYEGPDVFNPSLHPPKGAVDVLSIVEAGRAFQPVVVPNYALGFYKTPKFETSPKVPVGKGMFLDTYAGDYYCDGTVDSWCNRGPDQTCLLKHHNDGRNGIKFDGYSGWVVLNLPDVRHGFIVAKIETWHDKDVVPKTSGWTSVNNEEGPERRRLGGPAYNGSIDRNFTMSESHSQNASSSERWLKAKQIAYCDQFQLQFAIDGVVTSYNVTEFDEVEKKGHIDRVIETFVLLNDRDYTGGEEKEVEAAIRIIGCGRTKTFNLNHIYWA